ncbi:hypothetical protein E2562_033984 [Oryza meyeriana var. granulata]|uniref:Uncharacterized protein n=1 Tax=Oryza meyeriana var. granulata TaxID=110450 RepID=A0A6G1ESB3_9ORYZ|nr:hypothetical protein E2562_033984 [Oryza meyeriana var. granulata]
MVWRLTGCGLRPQRRRWRRLPGEGGAGQQGSLQGGTRSRAAARGKQSRVAAASCGGGTAGRGACRGDGGLAR